MKTPIKLDIEPGAEWLLPAAKRWLEQAKRVMRTPLGAKVFDLPSGEKVTVQWRQGLDYVRISGAGLPYWILRPYVATPYELDHISFVEQYDIIADMINPSGVTYSWAVTDSDTGAVYSSGVGVMDRTITSCGGGGCSFHGNAVNIPFYGTNGGTADSISYVGSTSGCSNVTCFNSEHLYYRVAELLFNNRYSRVITTLNGVIAQAPFLGGVGSINPWDGSEIITGRVLSLLYGFAPPWLNGSLYSAYLDTLNGSDLGPSSFSFSLPSRVAYTTDSISDTANKVLIQIRRAVSMEDWSRLRDELSAGTPPLKFIRSIATGISSGKAVRTTPISVGITNTTVGVVQTRAVHYSYDITDQDGQIVEHVVGDLRGTTTTENVYQTRRSFVVKETDVDYLVGVRANTREFVRMPPPSVADLNAEFSPPAGFLKKYWADIPLREANPGEVPQPTYAAAANTPRTAGKIVLFSPAYTDEELNAAIGVAHQRATAAYDSALQDYQISFGAVPPAARVGIGPVSALAWQAAATIPEPAAIAVHGVVSVKYDAVAGEFVFSRWEDLGGFVIEIPPGVNLAPKTNSSFSSYTGYPWSDIVTAAEVQKDTPTPEITFIRAAINSARAALV